MEELKPCPFCGGDAAMVSGAIDGAEHYIAKCRNCHSTTGVMQMSAEMAAGAWNVHRERTCRMSNDDWASSYGEYKHLYECGICCESTALLCCVNENGDMDWVKPRFCGNCGAKVVGE